MKDDLASIMRMIGIPEDQIQAVGRLAPWTMPRDFEAIKAAIAADPCRNWLTVSRRYHVSRRTVYRAWKMAG